MIAADPFDVKPPVFAGLIRAEIVGEVLELRLVGKVTLAARLRVRHAALHSVALGFYCSARPKIERRADGPHLIGVELSSSGASYGMALSLLPYFTVRTPS